MFKKCKKRCGCSNKGCNCGCSKCCNKGCNNNSNKGTEYTIEGFVCLRPTVGYGNMCPTNGKCKCQTGSSNCFKDCSPTYERVSTQCCGFLKSESNDCCECDYYCECDTCEDTCQCNNGCSNECNCDNSCNNGCNNNGCNCNSSCNNGCSNQCNSGCSNECNCNSSCNNVCNNECNCNNQCNNGCNNGCSNECNCDSTCNNSGCFMYGKVCLEEEKKKCNGYKCC